VKTDNVGHILALATAAFVLALAAVSASINEGARGSGAGGEKGLRGHLVRCQLSAASLPLIAAKSLQASTRI
jgi:hypothetical protein